MHRHLALLGLVVALAGCPRGDELGTSTQALNGLEGGFDFALDLPWRMERHELEKGPYYDPVPITIAILDEDTNDLDSGGRLYEVCRIDVSDSSGKTREFGIADLEWIEKTGRKPGTTYWSHASEQLPAPWHGVCHPAAGNCSAFAVVHDTSEWHALLLWDGPSKPGGSEVLTMTAHVTGKDNDCFSERAHMIQLVNYAKVTWAADALPRFGDDRWLYGDLHYHSQSTDNEGESGYAYRASLHGAAAIGLDFVFATDHASDSLQIVDGDLASHAGTGVWELGAEYQRGLRDLNQARFDVALELIHGPGGANDELASWWPAGRPRVPSLFLGAEVDVVPEQAEPPAWPEQEPTRWQLPYGNDKLHDLQEHVCSGGIACSVHRFELDEMLPCFVDAAGHRAWSVADLQGIDNLDLGRQHVLHLPRFADEPTGFVASRTGPYGGGSRHLIEGVCPWNACDGGADRCEGLGVLPEIESKHGIAFLAHPLSAGGGDRGPGAIPYTRYQYEKMFDQRALVGLEFWNESPRLQADRETSRTTGYGEWEVTGYTPLNHNPLDGDISNGSHEDGFDDGYFSLVPVDEPSTWRWASLRFDTDSDLHNGAAQWDQLLRWGLDRGRTESIKWLPSGEPRRLFVAGGSDAHGDLNYRRHGYFRTLDKTTDTALGNVRNLVFAGKPRPPCAPWGCEPGEQSTTRHSQDQIVDALADGRFAVTDGPALRIGVDRNRDGDLDDTDAQMGAVIDLFDDEDLPVFVQWESTPELGDVARIDLYVGVAYDPCPADPTVPCSARPDEGVARTYAADNHFVRVEANEAALMGWTGADPDADPGHCVFDPDGVCRFRDHYYRPASEAARQALHLEPGSLRGQTEIRIDPDDFFIPGSRPTRLYVRAVAVTSACDRLDPANAYAALRGGCIERYAMTNPVWALRHTLPTGGECPFSDRALDQDGDGLPDACDAFPTQPNADSWTRVFGGAGLDAANQVAFDAAGALFVAGSVYGPSQIEGGGPSQPLPAQDHDGLVAKYDRDGALLATFRVTGPSWATVHDLAVDAAGDVYAVGSFIGTAGFGPSTQTALRETGFLVKLRGADLQVVWVRTLAGQSTVTLRRVTALPGALGVAVAGDFTRTIDSNLGTFTASGASDCVFAAYHPSGQIQTIKQLGGDGPCTATELAADGLGRTYLAASYAQGVVHGGTTLPRASAAGLVARFGAPNAQFAAGWLVGFSSDYTDQRAAIGGLAVDPIGTVTVGGSYTGALVFARPGAPPIVAQPGTAGGWDLFTARLTEAGALVPGTTRTYGGDGDDTLRGLDQRSNGDLALAGAFTSSRLTFGDQVLTRRAPRDGFLAFVLANGAVRPARNYGTVAENRGYGIALAPGADARLATCGVFHDPARIDDRRTVHALGAWDAFAAVLSAPAAPTGSFGTPP